MTSIAKSVIEQINAAPDTGDYSTDCSTGRQLAETIIAGMQSTGFPGALGFVVRDIIAKGKFEALHIGFFNTISECVIA